MRRRPPRQEPVRCRCEGGADRAKEHAKPGAKAADHGEPFLHIESCIHSELQHTTKARKLKRLVNSRALRNALKPKGPRPLNFDSNDLR